MAQDSTALGQYNFVNCELIVCDTNEFELLEATDDVEIPSFYLQEGQYVLPIDSGTVQEDSNVEEYLVENVEECAEEEEEKVNESDQLIIYCTAEQYAEYLQANSKDTTPHASDIIIDEVLENEVSMKRLTSDINDTSELEDSNESGLSAEYQPYEKVLEQSNYHYAILKNGILHLQALDIEDKHKSYLKKQLEALQASISFDSSRDSTNTSERTTVDLDKITGKNLITGETVTLDEYMEKLLSSCTHINYLNKKIVIGKTTNGRRLVGKILQVKKGDTNIKMIRHKNRYQPNPKLKAELNKQIENANKVTETSIITDAVGDILVCVINLQKFHQTVYNKDLVVKLFRSTDSLEDGVIIRNAYVVHGYMKHIDHKWHFFSTNVEEYKTNNKTSSDNNTHQEVQNEKTEDTLLLIPQDAYEHEKLQEVSNSKAVHLALQLVINKDGKASANLYIHPNTLSSINNEGFEIVIQDTLFGCDECFKTFLNEATLFQHKKVHCIQRWCNTICMVCRKTFNSAGSLKRHFTVHDPSLRPLQCTVCLQRFTNQSSLRKHLIIHTGIRAFLCKVCHRSFINQGDLNFHSRIHDPVKLFTCKVCGREFSRQSNLFRHSEIHSSNSTLYQCHICGCSYSFPASLTRHIVHKHIGDITT